VAFGSVALMGGVSARAADQVPVRIDDDVQGKADARVTIIEYASLTCPHCADFHTNTLPLIKKQWVETGKARLIFRDFPLDGLAMGAAMIAHCAPKDHYFALLSALFETQNTWARAANPADELKKLAKLGGIPEDKFASCVEDKALAERITAGQREAQDKYGVNSTPSFLVNGKLITGAKSFDEFDAILKEAAGSK